jgi:hypothetical protein
MIPERLRLFRTIPHYLTNQPNSQNAGALPHRQPMLHPSYLAVLKRFRVEHKAGGELSSSMTSRETGGYSGAEWWLL